MPKLKLVENERAYRRVNVNLRGALCVPGKPITMVRTRNVSEGGIAITLAKGEVPACGTSVKLQLDGVVSSNAEPSFDIYSMKVVYSGPSAIGLAFDHK
ncbi:MAG: PilZ domain-containing protein [Pseudomonadales bacterium]